jgi:hypothetical protein
MLLQDQCFARRQRKCRNLQQPQQQQVGEHGDPLVDKATALPSHFTPDLLAMTSNNMDRWDRATSECTLSDSSSTARNTAVLYYGLATNKHCQILGEQTENVINAHIWSSSNKINLVLVETTPSDVDAKNILRLHRDIKQFFDHKQVTFIQSGSECFLLKVLDPSIGDEVLKGTSLTFNDIDWSPLIFPNGNMPWCRLLVTHSIFAHRHARDRGWLPSDELSAAALKANDEMECSLDAEAQARVNRIWQRS